MAFGEEDVSLAVGRAILAWQSVEARAYEVLSWVLKPISQPKIALIWRSHAGFNSKLALVTKLLREHGVPSDAMDLWNTLVRRMHSAHDCRSRIAHAEITWDLKADAPLNDRLQAFAREREVLVYAEKKRIALADIQAAQAEFISLNIEVLTFLEALIETPCKPRYYGPPT